jgi:hypothetical protein
VRAFAALLLLPAALALADEPGLVTSGTWIAAAPNQLFRGRWSARVLAETPDAAVGSWTLDNEGGDVVMEGTWSARKAPRAWRGTWSARIQGARTPAGQPTYGPPFGGTWEADPRGLTGKTFGDMLKQTAQHQVTGTWRYHRLRGTWWLER